MTPIDPPLDTFKQRQVAPGEIIFLESQVANVAYVILKGEVQAGSQSPDGKFVVLNRMNAGELFGEIALLRPDSLRTASAMSEAGCELMTIPREIFDTRLEKADPLLRFIIQHLCRRLIHLQERITQAELDE